jgi:hypothetical protein
MLLCLVAQTLNDASELCIGFLQYLNEIMLFQA